ncbi:ARM protein [Phytophthora pseudosyringae]|uniref:ARM protein n=1 Tax=Phytophthora pseudosyringae TaxID=221518 RepID=A0A8T1VXP4_9STRA|nr:ARM protein [Phytophthora pseudosyringae]
MTTTMPTDLLSEDSSFFVEAAETGGDDRVEADRAVFARSASIRRLSSATMSRKGSIRRPSLLLGASSTPQLPASSPLRRPATAAATTHSRVHQALRDNDNSFEFSSKEATLDGLCYSSRFPIKEITSRGIVSSRIPSATLLRKDKNSSTSETKQNTDDLSASRNENADPSAECTPEMDIQAKKKEMRRQLLAERERSRSAAPTSMSGSSSESGIKGPVAVIDGAAFILRKRRCAKTFEEMIAGRLRPHESARDAKTNTKSAVDAVHSEHEGVAGNGINKLLEHGIIQSVLALSTSSDAATQGHCCRALYYLSGVRTARKAMITHGVAASLKQLSRTTAPVPRQDMAATLCHLSEEENVVEALFFEGIDRSLLRLITSPSWETKRICAATVFNLSADARHNKHFREVFAQLLIAATKTNGGMGDSSLPNTKSSIGLNSSSAFLIKATYNTSLVPIFHSALLGENIPRFLTTHMPLVPPAIQGWALRAFVSLGEVRANRQLLLSSSFCELLESVLLSPNEEIQEITLLILLQLSTDEGSRIKICNWLPISSLIQTASQHIEKALSATKSVRTGKRGDLLNFEQPESKTKENSLVYLHSCILRNLCDSVLTHHELIQEGAVPVLLEMSRMSDPTVKVNAICSLCYLISSSTEEVANHIPELTELLLTLTQSPNDHDCLFAVEALYNISCCDDCVPLLCESGSLLDRLLHLATDPTHKKVAELVAATVYRLAGVVSCAPQLLRRGFLTQLVHLIRQYPTCRAYALNALFLLARNCGEEFPHGGDEMTQLVLALLSNGSELEMAAKMWISKPLLPARLVKRKTNLDISQGDPATIRSGVTLLAHLAHHPKNRAALVRNGAVFRFLKKLNRLKPKTKPKGNSDDGSASGAVEEKEETEQDSEDDTILTNCAFVYYCLTATQEGCEFLVKERGVEDLINLSRIRTKHTGTKVETSDGAVAYTMKEMCTLALCRLSSFAGLESRLIEQGAIQAVMVLALVATDSITIKALCIMTLANCLVDVTPHCLQSLIGHGIIWALSSLCTVEYPEVSYVCAVSLCNLSVHASKISKFLDAGAPRALIHLLSHSGGADAAEDAAIVLVTVKTIANLIANEKLCQAFLNEGLEKHLSVHFSSPESSEELRQMTAMVLLRVTSANDAVISPERVKLTMLLWMEQIIDMKDEDLVRNCMLTVHDLTSNSSLGVTELDVPHILRILVQVLQRHHTRNTQVVTLCLSVLYNLSCQVQALPMIVQSEIMPFLRQQVPLTESTLAAQRRKSATCSDNPALPAPTQFTPNLSVNVQLCCLVLHNLSCCHTADDEHVSASLVYYHAVATLHDIYFGPFGGLRETAAVAICNIAVGKVNSSRVLEDHAGRVLLHFIRSEHFLPKHYHLVAATLRKLSNAPGNQTCLLNARLANAMVFLLTLPNMDNTASSNILAALRHISSCKTHLSRLLNDGVLPCVVKLADQPHATAEMVNHCFELISNLCSVDFQEYLKDCPEINVIGTLAKLSDHHKQSHHHHHLVQQERQEPTTSLASYCARGEGSSLPSPQLITNLMKSATFTTGAAKKTLQIKANYTVPARKWSPQAQPKPKDPPPLVCNEIPPTDNGQIVAPEVKQRIGCFTPLPKEPLVRDEKNDAMDSPAVGAPKRSTLARSSSERSFGVGGLRSRSRNTSVVGARKVLQRGHESRHLSGWSHRSES